MIIHGLGMYSVSESPTKKNFWKNKKKLLTLADVIYILYAMKLKNVFTTFDIAKLFDIPRSNVQQYIDRGLLTPSMERTQGRGTKNLFSLNDLYRFRLFQKLYAVGLSQREAAENSCLIDFSKIGKKGVNWVKIVRDKNKIRLVRINEGSIQTELYRNDIFIAINLLRIKEEIEALVGKEKGEIDGMKEVAKERSKEVRVIRIGKKSTIR